MARDGIRLTRLRRLNYTPRSNCVTHPPISLNSFIEQEAPPAGGGATTGVGVGALYVTEKDSADAKQKKGEAPRRDTTRHNTTHNTLHHRYEYILTSHRFYHPTHPTRYIPVT